MERTSGQAGWTLAELLISVAIIAILAVIFLLMNWKRQIYRAQDATRKTDLVAIRQAFEEYYNDNDCYPSVDILNTCEGSGLSPYVRAIPCDPTTREPYKYEPDSDTNLCGGYRLCAKLQDAADPDITTIGCHSEYGCGWGENWNYCLAMGTTVTAPGFNPAISPTPTIAPTPTSTLAPTPTSTPTLTPTAGPTPTPTSTPTPTIAPTPTPTPSYGGNYACSPDGTCNAYDNPALHGCPISWAGACPVGACDNPSNRCTD